MNDMLRDLYYGRINPSEMKLAWDGEIDTMIERSKELEKEISGSLDEAGREKFTEFMNVEGDFGDSQQFSAFCRGFRIGVRLMVDTFTDEVAKK